MLNKKFTGVAQVDLSNMGKVLSDYKEAFSELHTPYITAQIIGVSSASCESSFSTLSRVLKSFRPHYASWQKQLFGYFGSREDDIEKCRQMSLLVFAPQNKKTYAVIG